MKKFFLFLLPIIALSAFLYLLRTPDIDPETALDKYAYGASQFAENSQGLKVHYRDEGNPDGIPIILLHGTSSSLHTWEPLVRELGGEYRIITYTQPGHGLTGPHPRNDYSFAGMADALNLIVEGLTLDRFVLGGNSMGGWVAWRYALAHPDRIEALILLDAAGMPLREGEKAPPLNLGFRLMGNPLGRFMLRHFTPRFLVEKSALQSVAVKSIMTDKAVDRYWELLLLPDNRRAAILRAKANREPEYAARVAEISAPTLIIWGAEDQLIYQSAAQTFDDRMQNADVVVYQGVGHLPMEEAPERTALDIDAFLERTINRTLEN